MQPILSVGTTSAEEKEGYSVRQKCAKLYGVGKLFPNLDNQSMETSQLAKSVEKKEGFCKSVVYYAYFYGEGMPVSARSVELTMKHLCSIND